MPSGARSALLTEKANAILLIPQLLNTLIRATKTVDLAILGVKILEHWQYLKVYGILLDQYLGDDKMEQLKREVKSSTGIQLKTLPCWLINNTRLREKKRAEISEGRQLLLYLKKRVWQNSYAHLESNLKELLEW